MGILEVFRVAFAQIGANKFRSFLTLLGITLGVWFTISVASIMTAFTEKMVETSNSLAPDVFQVDRYPRSRGRQAQRTYHPQIKAETAERLEERCPHVLIAAAEDSKNQISIKANGIETNNTLVLYGAQDGFQTNNNWPIERGRAINEDDNKSSRNVIVLGADAVNKLFPTIDPIGQTVNVEGHTYRVIGTMEEQGAFMGSNRNNQNAIPLSTFHKFYGERSTRITFKATSINDRDQAMEEVRAEMRLINKVPPGEADTFGMWTNESSGEDMVSFFGTVSIAASGLGFIALFVGGIGVMNIMLATVKERTREIGIRKSIGARKRTIMFQFLFEAVTLCLFGGLIGLVIGVATGGIVSALIGAGFAIPYDFVIISIIFTSLIGIGFGVIPAMQAAKLDPIEALRYE